MTDKPPRKPRGFERGGKAFKSMPSGIPAMGEGLHGPASGIAPQAFTAENQPSAEAKLAGVDVAAEIRERIAAKKFMLADKLLHLAEHGEAEAVQLAATNAALDRIMGKPAQAIGGDPSGAPLQLFIHTGIIRPDGTEPD